MQFTTYYQECSKEEIEMDMACRRYGSVEKCTQNWRTWVEEVILEIKPRFGHYIKIEMK
jgi:hypothetical protein